MMHLSYDQQITLIKRLVAPLNVDEIDAALIPMAYPASASICVNTWQVPWWRSPTSAV